MSTASRTRPARPILKWAGGKSRLLDQLHARLPAAYGRYFEPFLGGGALFFSAAPRVAVLGDLNGDLMNVYRSVAEAPEVVGRLLSRHKRAHCEAYYYHIRAKWNARSARQTTASRAAQFLYLNKTCFNGLYRVNRQGQFNVPIGRYVNPTIFEPSLLLAASRALQTATLLDGDYQAVAAQAKEGDFVYFDPPYHPRNATSSFTSYTASAFHTDDQAQLRDVADALVERGCVVVLSNSDTPLVRDLYSGWAQEVVLCRRSINSKAASRGPIAELLLTHPSQQRMAA